MKLITFPLGDAEFVSKLLFSSASFWGSCWLIFFKSLLFPEFRTVQSLLGEFVSFCFSNLCFSMSSKFDILSFDKQSSNLSCFSPTKLLSEWESSFSSNLGRIYNKSSIYLKICFKKCHNNRADENKSNRFIIWKTS